MGFLERRAATSADMLRLPGRSVMARDVAQQRDRQVAVEAARTQVQIARMQGLAYAGEAAMFAVGNLSRQAEIAASMMPEERHRLDSIPDTVAAAITRLIVELGQ